MGDNGGESMGRCAVPGRDQQLHRPASAALIADLVPSERRVTAFTLQRLAINVGWAADLSLGGLLAERSFACALWTLGEMISAPVSSAIAADRAPDHARGRYQSALESIWGIGWILGPVLGTFVYSRSHAALGRGVAWSA